MGRYRLTCFCSACNSPKGSRQTASGSLATAGTTVAVHPSKYSKNKQITIEGIGTRLIQDKHGNSPDVIDIYVGECQYCNCSSHPYSGRIVNVNGM